MEIELEKAAGYRLAQAIKAKFDIPSQAQCVRDGYAVIAADTLGAGDYNPLPFRLLDTGSPLNSGKAVQVNAGDPVPKGADAVLSLQQAERRSNFLDVSTSLAPGEGILTQGEEGKQSTNLLDVGRQLRAQDLASIALAGIKSARVYRKPRVELILAGHFDQDTISPMLCTLIARDGGEMIAKHRVSTAETLGELYSNSNTDLMLVVGSTGYGTNDYAVQALKQRGTVSHDGVTIHPGGGIVLGQVKEKPALLLPGSALSCLCAYDLLGARLLRRLAGKTNPLPYRCKSYTLSRKLVSRIGQLELARMRINGEYAEALAVADDRLLSSSVRADGFTLLAEHSEGYAEGRKIEVYLYDEQ